MKEFQCVMQDVLRMNKRLFLIFSCYKKDFRSLRFDNIAFVEIPLLSKDATIELFLDTVPISKLNKDLALQLPPGDSEALQYLHRQIRNKEFSRSLI